MICEGRALRPSQIAVPERAALGGRLVRAWRHRADEHPDRPSKRPGESGAGWLPAWGLPCVLDGLGAAAPGGQAHRALRALGPVSAAKGRAPLAADAGALPQDHPSGRFVRVPSSGQAAAGWCHSARRDLHARDLPHTLRRPIVGTRPPVRAWIRMVPVTLPARPIRRMQRRAEHEARSSCGSGAKG